jgi:hypothetical protein
MFNLAQRLPFARDQRLVTQIDDSAESVIRGRIRNVALFKALFV